LTIISQEYHDRGIDKIGHTHISLSSVLSITSRQWEFGKAISIECCLTRTNEQTSALDVDANEQLAYTIGRQLKLVR